MELRLVTLTFRRSSGLIIAAFFGYSFYLLSNLVFMVLFPPLMILLFWNLPLQYRVATAVFNVYNWFLTRVYLPTLRIYRVREESGFDRFKAGEPAIFIANHRSRMDGPFLIPLMSNIGVVIKSSYARMPLYRGLVRYLNFVSVDPHSIDSLAGAMRECKSLLAAGKRLLIFPEGTRASGTRLNVFKELAFRLSIESGVPIVPCIIHTDMPFMAKIKGSYFPGRTFNLVLRALDAEYVRKNERAGEFAERIRRAMAVEIRTLDAGTHWERYSRAPNGKVHIHCGAEAAYDKKTEPRQQVPFVQEKLL